MNFARPKSLKCLMRTRLRRTWSFAHLGVLHGLMLLFCSTQPHRPIKVIEPAVLEVNGLSDIGVQIELVRRHSRAPVTAVTLVWWKKQGDEFRSAVQERGRSKMGRMARLRGTVEVVAPLNLPPLV